MVSFIKLFGFPIHKLVEKHDDIHNRFIIKNVIFPRDFPTINRMKIIGFFLAHFIKETMKIFRTNSICAHTKHLFQKKTSMKEK